MATRFAIIAGDVCDPSGSLDNLAMLSAWCSRSAHKTQPPASPSSADNAVQLWYRALGTHPSCRP